MFRDLRSRSAAIAATVRCAPNYSREGEGSDLLSASAVMRTSTYPSTVLFRILGGLANLGSLARGVQFSPPPPKFRLTGPPDTGGPVLFFRLAGLQTRGCGDGNVGLKPPHLAFLALAVLAGILVGCGAPIGLFAPPRVKARVGTQPEGHRHRFTCEFRAAIARRTDGGRVG